jgi:hypothetical protein
MSPKPSVAQTPKSVRWVLTFGSLGLWLLLSGQPLAAQTWPLLVI